MLIILLIDGFQAKFKCFIQSYQLSNLDREILRESNLLTHLFLVCGEVKKLNCELKMWTILILIFTILYLIYRWYTWNYDYFEKRGIPAIKAKFPLGNTPNGLLAKRNVLYDFDDLYK